MRVSGGVGARVVHMQAEEEQRRAAWRRGWREEEEGSKEGPPPGRPGSGWVGGVSSPMNLGGGCQGARPKSLAGDMREQFQTSPHRCLGPVDGSKMPPRRDSPPTRGGSSPTTSVPLSHAWPSPLQLCGPQSHAHVRDPQPG